MKLLSVTPERHKFQIIWDSNYWDGPLDGICIYNGQLCRFIGHDNDDPGFDAHVRFYYIYELDFIEKLQLKVKQWLFELCIGRHCTYTNGRREMLYRQRMPKWFWKIVSDLYYKGKI